MVEVRECEQAEVAAEYIAPKQRKTRQRPRKHAKTKKGHSCAWRQEEAADVTNTLHHET